MPVALSRGAAAPCRPRDWGRPAKGNGFCGVGGVVAADLLRAHPWPRFHGDAALSVYGAADRGAGGVGVRWRSPPAASFASGGCGGWAGRRSLLFRLDATILYRLHPDEYLFYKPIVGGLEGASRRYATDYWVNIMPEAVGDLEHFLDRTEPASDKLSARRYLVGVCGERLSFEKEADARLQWTRDWAHADFFISPTHMNCDRALEGQVVATVERLGVLIGVVKDRRALIHRHLSYSGPNLFAGID